MAYARAVPALPFKKPSPPDIKSTDMGIISIKEM